jgi:signal transduction histidine kinase
VATRQISGGDYSVRLEENRTDELGDLSRDFNSMASQLQEASEKLTRFEARRQQFMSDVSHELRTPLTSIRGIMEGFRNNLVAPGEQAKYYSIIEKETFRLIRLINELMDMERIRTNMIQLDQQWHRAQDILEVVSESLDVLASEKQLKLEVECGDNVRLYGDYDRLMQITINLVKNAIQFSDFGTVRLKAEEQQSYTLIEISDQGRGMTRSQIEQMWERFYKADPSRVKDKSETGLGLSIVKQLVEAHGGMIEVLSEPGIGTKIALRFPKSEDARNGQADDPGDDVSDGFGDGSRVGA